MRQVVIVDRDGESIASNVGRQTLGHRPRPQDTVLLETKVEVRTRLAVIV
jgi:hypothetical protein